MFEFSSDKFSGEVWIGSVGQSGSASEESFQYRYVCVDGRPVFVYYSECLFGCGAVSGDEGGFGVFHRCGVVFFVRCFEGHGFSHGEFDVFEVSGGSCIVVSSFGQVSFVSE